MVHAHVADALADHRIANAQRIVIGGSGDSWFSALSVAPAFRRWTGLVTEARTAMELARYEIPMMGPSDLVISVSNSGSSSRAREAVLLAQVARLPDAGHHRQPDRPAGPAGRPYHPPPGH